MWQMDSGWNRPPFKRFVIAGMATIAVSAAGATALLPGVHPVTTDVAMMAAIDESNTTIGIADSDLYFASPAEIDAALDEMQAMGVNTVRIGIPWAGINPIPGYYDWSQSDYLINAADERGMGILAVITTTPTYAQNGSGVYSEPTDPALFGEFAGLAAERYAGKVGAYEIWNEPNAAPFYGPTPDPAGYTELLQAAYPAIKAADPDATVIGGVVGSTVTYQNLTINPVDFVDQMYAAGAQGYFDALSFHPYQYTMPFSTGGYHPDSPINQLDDIHDLMLANGDGDKLIWASEYGQPTAISSEQEQAAYIEDMLTTWRTIGYTGPAFVYTLQDTDSSSTDPEATFGLIRDDGTWKPAAYVVQELAQSANTTPELAAMALALPQADTAAPQDLATLEAIAGPTDPAAQTQLAAATTEMTATATEPVLATPTLATPTLVTPTPVATNEVAPTSATTIPTTNLDAAQSVESVATPTPKPTSTAPTSTAPTRTTDPTSSGGSTATSGSTSTGSTSTADQPKKTRTDRHR